MTNALALLLAAGAQEVPADGADVATLGPAEILIFSSISAVFVALAVGARWAHPRVVERVWPHPEPSRPAFTMMDVGVVVLGYVWVLLLVSLVLGMVVPDGGEMGLGLTLGASIAVQGGTCLVIYGLVGRRELGHAGLGLRPGRRREALLLGAAHYVGYAPFLAVALLMNPALLQLFGIEAEMQEVAVMIRESAVSERLLVAIAAVVVIPFLEEFMFRGFLQNALEEPFGKAGAVGLSSLAFAALHGVNAFIPIFVLSLVLGAVMLRTRRLAACWLVHAMHNGLTTALLFLAPSDLGT